MKPDEMPQLKTQISIVKTLLDGSTISQRQIASNIKKQESTVSRALDYLEKANVVIKEPQVIESGRRNSGKYKNNLCHLNYEVDIGLNVLQFFRRVLNLKTLGQQEADDIIKTLQKTDKILGILLDKHPELCLKELTPELREKAKKTPGVEEGFDGVIIPSEKEEFKKYLNGSSEFFKICLLNDTKYVLQKVSLIYYGFANEYVFDEEQLNTIYRNYVPQLRARNVLYKYCVIMDAL